MESSYPAKDILIASPATRENTSETYPSDAAFSRVDRLRCAVSPNLTNSLDSASVDDDPPRVQDPEIIRPALAV